MAQSKLGPVRQRTALAMGSNAGLPPADPEPKTPRFKAGGQVDGTTFQRYGNGFRRSSKGKRGA